MSEKELWQYFWDNKIFHAKPFDRDFIWIAKENFHPVKDNFKKEFNILQSGDSFRSKAYFKHIHTVDQGEYVLVHQDTGNVARFFPLGIIHFFFDVAPYMVIARVRGVRMKSLFTRPQ